MYDPMHDMVTERQRKIRQAADDSRNLASLRANRPSLRSRLFYSLGGMMIAFGTRLRERSPQPRTQTANPGHYKMSEGC